MGAVINKTNRIFLSPEGKADCGFQPGRKTPTGSSSRKLRTGESGGPDLVIAGPGHSGDKKTSPIMQRES